MNFQLQFQLFRIFTVGYLIIIIISFNNIVFSNESRGCQILIIKFHMDNLNTGHSSQLCWAENYCSSPQRGKAWDGSSKAQSFLSWSLLCVLDLVNVACPF